ncbi:MAG: hypothetical protein LIP01_00110 [Tannerellaceae bacterium]|nr:hypothetical protein [Tannerellaceae bacterium]
MWNEFDYTILTVKREGKQKVFELADHWGDTTSYSYKLGDYEATDSTLTIYTFWAKAGDAPVSPFGTQIQIYTPDSDGNWKKVSSELYIETVSAYYIKSPQTRDNLTYHVGGIYLHQKPQNKEEQKLFDNYIREVEKEYEGKSYLEKMPTIY